MELSREYIASNWDAYLVINKKEFNSIEYLVAVVGEDARWEHGGPTQKHALNEYNKWKEYQNILGTCELVARGQEVFWRRH